MNLRTLTDDSQLVSLINLAAQLFPTGGDCLADAKIEEFVDILDRVRLYLNFCPVRSTAGPSALVIRKGESQLTELVH